MHLIEGKLKQTLLQQTTAHSPNETAGLILPDGSVIELTNYDDEPFHAFKLSVEEIKEALEGVEEADLLRVCIWHSHPGGNIGPSRIDLQQKTRFTYHLVLSLVDGDIVPTWY